MTRESKKGARLGLIARQFSEIIGAMKKIITPGVREEAEYVCDVTGKPAYGKLLMTFGYVSHHDTQILEMDLADEAADEVIQFLKSKSPGIKLRYGPLYSCPFCLKGIDARR